jgi:hypothetical protein
MLFLIHGAVAICKQLELLIATVIATTADSAVHVACNLCTSTGTLSMSDTYWEGKAPPSKVSMIEQFALVFASKQASSTTLHTQLVSIAAAQRMQSFQRAVQHTAVRSSAVLVADAAVAAVLHTGTLMQTSTEAAMCRVAGR